MAVKKIQSEYPNLDKYNIGGNIYYYKKNTDILHNPYGPAIIYKDGYKAYWIEGKVHRLDGPAVIFADGDIEYWINGNIQGNSKQKFYNNIKNLDSKYINKQDKINILDIKNSLSHNLAPSSFNILKSLL